MTMKKKVTRKMRREARGHPFNTFQLTRGCRHVEVQHALIPDPQYGDKAPLLRSAHIEVDCDKSCGGRA